MVSNALAGIAAGYALGMTDGQIARGIEANVPIRGRSNLIETGKYTVIDDCYNANPASVKASLDVLSCADTRTVAVLGDMFELGEHSGKMHYDTGVHAAQTGIDVLVCIGSLSADTARGAQEAAREKGQTIKVVHYTSKEEFFEQADSLLKENDTILVKASHGMEFSKIVDWLQN